MILIAIDLFVRVAQTPVLLHMAENAGQELCAMARRGELQTWKWPQPIRGIVNDSPSLPEELRNLASRLADGCMVRAYPTALLAVVIHIRPHEANRPIARRVARLGYCCVSANDGRWIVLGHHLLWTPLFDLLRGEPYAGRIEIGGFGTWSWGIGPSIICRQFCE